MKEGVGEEGRGHLVLGVEPCSSWRDLVYHPQLGAELVGQEECCEVSAHKPSPCREREREA